MLNVDAGVQYRIQVVGAPLRIRAPQVADDLVKRLGAQPQFHVYQAVQHALDADVCAGQAADRSKQSIIATGEDETVDVSGRDAVVEHPR